MRYAKLENSYVRLLSHEYDECANDVCSLHKRTDHHMREYKQIFSYNMGIMLRFCSHDVGHPDPDDAKIINGSHDGTHQCDGCCIRFATEEEVMRNGLR